MGSSAHCRRTESLIGKPAVGIAHDPFAAGIHGDRRVRKHLVEQVRVLDDPFRTSREITMRNIQIPALSPGMNVQTMNGQMMNVATPPHSHEISRAAILIPRGRACFPTTPIPYDHYLS